MPLKEEDIRAFKKAFGKIGKSETGDTGAQENKGAFAKERLDRAEALAKSAVPGIFPRIEADLKAARKELLQAKADAFSTRMDEIERSLDKWIMRVAEMSVRLDDLQNRLDATDGDEGQVQTHLDTARDAVRAFDEALVDREADNAETLLVSLERIANAPPEEKATEIARKRYAETRDEVAALAPFDPKLAKSAGKKLDLAEKCLDSLDAPGAESHLDDVDRRLDAAMKHARTSIRDRITELRGKLDAEKGDGVDLTAVTKLLDAARTAAGQNDFATAKAEADRAERLVMQLQDAREIDLSKGLKKIWKAAFAEYGDYLQNLQSELAAIDTPETKLLATLGVDAWIVEPGRQIDRAIASLKSIKAGPAGQLDRLAAVAAFRDARETLIHHPAVDVIRKNPLKVTFTTKGIRKAISQMVEDTLEA